MKLTLKQNINKESVVLKHKIALETITLLEGREKLLYTDYMLYTMISLVDNFIEEELLALINNDERDFTLIVEESIEPCFNEIIKEEMAEVLFYEILNYVADFKDTEESRRLSAIGFLDYILEMVGEFEWEDLKYFFNRVAHNAQENLIEIERDKKQTQQPVTRDEFEGADEKMKALIQKFQRQGQELKK